MKLVTHCIYCHPNDGKIRKTYQFTISDKDFIEFTCENNHHNFIHIANYVYDIIFESGLNAMREGYLREAVSSFYASLESFYDEMTHALLRINGIDNSQGIKTVKTILKTGERKLSAFNALFLVTIKSDPYFLHENMVELRNKVIHGVKYPTIEEVVSLGEAIRDCIEKNFECIISQYSKFYETHRNLRFNELGLEAEKKKMKFSQLTFNFYLSYLSFINRLQGGERVALKDYVPQWQGYKAQNLN